MIKTERLLIGILLAGVCTACTSEFSVTETDGLSDKTVQIASVYEEAVTKSDSPLLPPDGIYWLGYKTTVGNTVNNKIHPLTIKDGVIEGTVSKEAYYDSGLYWANVTKESSGNAKFTLSNMEDKPDETVYTDKKDVLWDGKEAWMTPLAFTLSHRMAQVSVELTSTLEANVTIKSVSITSVKQSYKFLRGSGTVEATASGTSLSLSKDDEEKEIWSALLPPQDRDDKMALTVATSDGETYSRTLPYSMIQNTGGSNTESIVLKFRQGYILNLTATVTNTIDYTIFFTGATLENWLYKGEHSVVAKPAGIYTESELKDWVTKYNAYQKDGTSEKNRETLLRYGTYKAEEAPNWTFTISRNIMVANLNGYQVEQLSDKLTKLNNYGISGIEQADLIKETTGDNLIDADLFKITQP